MNIARARLMAVPLALAAIIVLGLALRIYGVWFGLPALYDPDEPTFILASLHMLRDHTPDPGWFGHPGTTTIYALALLDLATLLIGKLDGHFASVAAFGAAVYQNPGVVVLPGRLFIVCCGVACIVLTFVVGRRLFGAHVALVAAGLLAINPLHVEYSQIIRTDIHATVFMLACVLASLGIAQTGRGRDYLYAAIFIGVACATKWPAAAIAICPVGACAFRIRQGGSAARPQLRYLCMTAATAIATLLIVSPFLLIDYHTVIRNLGGEAQAHHLGATSAGFAAALAWYLARPIGESIGIVGLTLAVLGVVAGAREKPEFRWIVIPGFVLQIVLISAQSLVWARWVLPVLPFVSLFAALGLVAVARWVGARIGRPGGWLGEAALLLATGVPMMLAVRAGAAERLHDTRDLASAWILAHVPRSAPVLVEHFAFDLVRDGQVLRYPAGGAGCVDAAQQLRGEVRLSDVNGWRNGAAVLDLGTVDPHRLSTCRTAYAVLSDLDRYSAERARYPAELRNYREVLAGATLVATFMPQAGLRGGPLIRIFRLAPAVPPVPFTGLDTKLVPPQRLIEVRDSRE